MNDADLAVLNTKLDNLKEDVEELKTHVLHFQDQRLLYVHDVRCREHRADIEERVLSRIEAMAPRSEVEMLKKLAIGLFLGVIGLAIDRFLKGGV
jgi:hypothetical protein